jgi:hypothetical protein
MACIVREPTIDITLSSSQAGVDYQLYYNGIDEGAAVPGGGILTWPGITAEGKYTVTGENGTGCTSTMTGSVDVVMDPLPADAQMFTGSRLVCPDSSVTYTVPEIEDAESYNWTFPAGTDVTGNGTRTVNVRFQAGVGTVTVSVHGVNSCGSGLDYSDNVVVRPLPGGAGAITGSAAVCSGTLDESYSILPVADATSYQWTLPAGAILSGSNAAGNEITGQLPRRGAIGQHNRNPDKCMRNGSTFPACRYCQPAAGEIFHHGYQWRGVLPGWSGRCYRDVGF